MKKIVFPFISLLLPILLNAQYNYTEVDSTVTVEINGTKINAPFTGGYNTAQFSELDLDQDGTMDLLLYDRALGQIRPYINKGIPNVVSYQYAPEYAQFFPQIQDWLKTVDFNNDGKMDLIEGRSNIVVWENTSSPGSGLSFELSDKLQSLFSANSPSKITINPSRGSLPGFYDMNNDNDIDLFLFNSNAKSIDYHRNLSQERANDYIFDFERRNTCWGTFIESGANSDIFLDSCAGPIPPNGEISGIDYFGNTPYSRGSSKGLKHAGSTVSPIDIDNNGTMDLLIADVDGYQLKLLINEDLTGTNSHIISFQDSFPNYNKPVDLLFPAPYFIDVNNDGFKDMIVSPNVSNFTNNFPLGLDDIYYYENNATDGSYQFDFIENRFFIDQTLDFGINCHPTFIDYNKDGLQDLLIGNDGYVDSNLTDIKGQLALFENIGTPQVPSYKLIDINYLNITALKLDIQRDTNSRRIIPTVGDLDGDGDQDILIGEANGNIFFFEDTAIGTTPAEFKFHPEPFQGLNINGRSESNAPVLFDINGDSILDCLVSATGSQINYFLNFGSKTEPMLNIKVDSIIRQQGNTFRYYFRNAPNYSLLKIGEIMAVHNATKVSNNSFIELEIVSMNENENYIDCNNLTIPNADDSYNEPVSSAYMTYFNRSWGNISTNYGFLSSPRILPYREEGNIKLIVANSDGTLSYYNDISDTLNPTDTFKISIDNYLKNYGTNTFVGGTDLNSDGMIDLAIGNSAGGMKLLMAAGGVGVKEISNNIYETQNSFRLYPNPAKENVTIELLEKTTDLVSLKIRDSQGKLLSIQTINNQKEVIETASLPSGLYFITLEYGNKQSTEKLIIKP